VPGRRPSTAHCAVGRKGERRFPELFARRRQLGGHLESGARGAMKLKPESSRRRGRVSDDELGRINDDAHLGLVVGVHHLHLARVRIQLDPRRRAPDVQVADHRTRERVPQANLCDALPGGGHVEVDGGAAVGVGHQCGGKDLGEIELGINGGVRMLRRRIARNARLVGWMEVQRRHEQRNLERQLRDGHAIHEIGAVQLDVHHARYNAGRRRPEPVSTLSKLAG